ncbi:G-protein coupled receptor family C group 6 member A-like [Rhinatrema bivittatum]|uniref:G-protein coupled receptor family C group 6 member A-like n=1 Tax=Rhinatrema bivittatum TaxID=194408 RepID=UPI00112A4177|nr:G-protein coupled receptor family C group 6 member A-like [Rhinatrema bivittatum]
MLITHIASYQLYMTQCNRNLWKQVQELAEHLPQQQQESFSTAVQQGLEAEKHERVETCVMAVSSMINDVSPQVPCLMSYVFAHAFKFAVEQSNRGRSITLGYKLVTTCEQPSDCPNKILEEIEKNHTQGLQTIVTIFFHGTELFSSSPLRNVPQVKIDDLITIYKKQLKGNYEGALESLMSLLKIFHWNLVGFMHIYDSDLTDLIEDFDKSDRSEVCMEFKHHSKYNGKLSAEKISSSQSNVTVILDTFTILWYMKGAMDKQEVAPITGKQIIHCCIHNIFHLEELMFKDFHGILSMCKKSRPVPGFLKYLLDKSRQGLGNTTAASLFQKICYPCAVNAGYMKPCKNLNTIVPINTSAGYFTLPKSEECPESPANICRSCLTRLAEMDTNFIIYSFVNKLGLATEEMYRAQHPSLPHNGSHFSGVQYQKFITANYSPLVPDNHELFEVYYWKASKDGEMKLLKVDIDLERAEGKSYDSAARTVKVQDGETITMLTSYCPRSCSPGERSKLHPHFPQHCCYECKACDPGTYSNGSAFGKCWSCPQDEWSHQGQQSCWRKSTVYLSWSDPVSMLLMVLALSGMALTISVLALYVKHKDTPIVKLAGGPVFYCNMASLLCSFASLFLFIGEPRTWKCKLRMPVFGVSFALCLASILAKSAWVLCAFASPLGKPTKLQTVLCRIILGAGPALQCAICCFWLFLDPPRVQRSYPTNQTYLILQCHNELSTGFSFLLGYLCFLVFICLLAAVKGHSLPNLFTDSQGISLAMMTFYAVWLSVMPVLRSRKEKFAERVPMISILLSSFSCLLFLFARRCYIILFRSNCNTTEWIKKSTYEHCQKIAENANLDLPQESSIATIESSVTA